MLYILVNCEFQNVEAIHVTMKGKIMAYSDLYATEMSTTTVQNR